MTIIKNIAKNYLRTIEITMKIKGMRKFQEFTVYPIQQGDTSILVQSDTRIARISLNGEGIMSKSHPNGANSTHLATDTFTKFTIEPTDWRQIVEYIGLTMGKNAGITGFRFDNSGAKSIFGLD